MVGQPVRVGQVETELVAPAPLHSKRWPVTSSGVHHGGAADRPADGQDYGRASECDGGAGAAVQPGIPVNRVGGAEFLDRPTASLLEHHGVEAGLGQGARHHSAAGAGADDHRVGGHDGSALGRGNDGQGRIGARRVMLLGARKQLWCKGIRAVGKQHDRLHRLEGHSGIRAERGEPAQHLITLAGIEARKRPAGGEVACRADAQQSGPHCLPCRHGQLREVALDAGDQLGRWRAAVLLRQQRGAERGQRCSSPSGPTAHSKRPIRRPNLMKNG